jgi:uncharacterized protein YndB with AHSA1/START domain
MPLKKDKDGNRSVEMQLILNATPEQVWDAIATGPGNAAWFTKMEIEPRVGGALLFDFGASGTSKGEVTVYDRPNRFVYVERDWAPGVPPCATEITIVGRAGGKCVMRMVHSLFTTSDEWDDQLESFESGWPGFFEVLRVYLAHFVGQPAATFITRVEPEREQRAMWAQLQVACGVDGANVGDRIESRSTPVRFSGVVEQIAQNALQRSMVIRLDAPEAGTILLGTYDLGSKCAVGLGRYCYGVGAEATAAAEAPVWQSWFEREFVAGD